MAKLPVKFRTQNESNIVTFQFSDFVNNIGYGTYYACIDRAGTQKLVPTTLEADAEAWILTSGGGTTTGTELNFDLLFNKQAVLRGPLYINCSYGGDAGAGGTVTAAESITIYHVDRNGVETTIGTQQVGETLSDNNNSLNSYRKLFIFDIAKKVFRPADKLRVEVILTLTTSGTGDARFWFDPANRSNAGNDPNATLTNQATTFIVRVPFVASVIS